MYRTERSVMRGIMEKDAKINELIHLEIIKSSSIPYPMVYLMDDLFKRNYGKGQTWNELIHFNCIMLYCPHTSHGQEIILTLEANHLK